MNENAAALTLSAAKSHPSGKSNNSSAKEILQKAKFSLAQSGKIQKDLQDGRIDHSQSEIEKMKDSLRNIQTRYSKPNDELSKQTQQILSTMSQHEYSDQKQNLRVSDQDPSVELMSDQHAILDQNQGHAKSTSSLVLIQQSTSATAQHVGSLNTLQPQQIAVASSNHLPLKRSVKLDHLKISSETPDVGKILDTNGSAQSTPQNVEDVANQILNKALQVTMINSNRGKPQGYNGISSRGKPKLAGNMQDKFRYSSVGGPGGLSEKKRKFSQQDHMKSLRNSKQLNSPILPVSIQL